MSNLYPIFTTLSLIDSALLTKFADCLNANFTHFVYITELGSKGDNLHIHCLFLASNSKTSNWNEYFRQHVYVATDASWADKFKRKPVYLKKLVVSKTACDKGTLVNKYFSKEIERNGTSLQIRGWTLDDVKGWPTKELIGKKEKVKKDPGFTTLSAPKATEYVFNSVKASGVCLVEPLTVRQLYYEFQKILIERKMTYSHLSDKQISGILDEVNTLLGYGLFVVEKKMDPDWDWKKERAFLEEQRQRAPPIVSTVIEAPAVNPEPLGALVLPDIKLDEIIN